MSHDANLSLNILLPEGGVKPALATNTSIRKVLIVEDEPVWQKIVERSVKQLDDRIEVTLCQNFDQALEAIRHNAYDFIVADQMLSGTKTGLDLWNMLRKNNIDIPYVILSGTKRSDFIGRLIPNRSELVPRYIEKPASIRKLSEQLHHVLRLYTSSMASVNMLTAQAKTEKDSAKYSVGTVFLCFAFAFVAAFLIYFKAS